MTRREKITFITTIYNEEKTIETFLSSISVQTVLPDEIIIVDAVSTDKTVEIIKKHEIRTKKQIRFLLLIKKGNRAVGRNEAVRNAKGEIIVCSDAGNILDKNWIRNITQPFINKNVDVVAGYYKGKVKSVFHACLIPYVLVMPDRVNPSTFLPATRSMAFRRSIWKKAHGFNEKLSHNEDYEFARRLTTSDAQIVFAKNAIVYWLPRDTFKEAAIMFFRFAFGDAEAGIFRNKVLLLFARYSLGIIIFTLILVNQSVAGMVVLLTLLVGYIIWAIKKNYRYVNDVRAFYLLPWIQLLADTAVMSGTILGLGKLLYSKNNSLKK